MPSEPPPDSTDADPAAAAVERPRDGEKRKKAKRPKPPIPRTEREIDAPDRLTLVMLGVMCFVTLALWGFARGGCNYHPPHETRRPRVAKTEELARDPKEAGLEMQQRLLTFDFDGALELASDAAVPEIQKQKATCAQDAQKCAEQKKKFARVVSLAVLLERDMGSATVRVTSETPNGKQPSILKLERRGTIWKVVSRVPDDGSYKPRPPAAEQGMEGAPPIQGLVPAPGGSGWILPIPSGLGSAAPKSAPAASARPVPKPKPAAPAALGSATP